ncbi:MAG TPA: AraC family transcriptional regulator, partial [Spirochaetota bacterium]|nr:AraC family transcriptional regulator [Spirochaetota bacterium]
HVPLVFMFIALYYIYDFEKSRKEKDLLYTALLRKSKNNIRALRSLKEKKKKAEPRNLIANVIEYLDANYAEKYDRIELSKKFGLNEDYMGQIFRKATGTNISNYININRINAARELLTDTNAKIIDVAYHVGFDNLTHFHRQFKRQTGCTPNEYRSIVKKNG